jgi:hypothetical protein
MKMCAVCVLLLGAGLSAQTKTDKKDTQKPEMITLSGCIVRGEHAPGQYTIDDKAAGTFRLTGTNVRDYLGRRVQIIGGIPTAKRLVIKGGLTPNPNVAAQGSSIDPALITVIAQGGMPAPVTSSFPSSR